MARAQKVDAGATPRQALRYRFEEGTVQRADVEYEFHTRRVAHRTGTESVLSWRSRIEIRVVSVDSSGVASCELVAVSGSLVERERDGTSKKFDLSGTQ